MDNCIFVSVPQECSFFVEEKCSAMSSYLIKCVQRHGRLVIREEAKDRLRALWEDEISGDRRVKTISGQAGRQASIKEEPHA